MSIPVVRMTGCINASWGREPCPSDPSPPAAGL